MKRLLAVCAGSLLLAACNDATAPITPESSAPVAPSNGPNADIRAGHYIIVLKSGAPSAEAVVQRHSFSKALTMDQRFKTVLHGFAAAVNDADVESLRNDPDVERVEPDRYVHQLGSETGMGWALDRVDQHDMPLNGAFAYGASGSGVNIYVIDGGIRYTHTEFGGRAHSAFDALGGDGTDCNGHGTGVAGVAAGSVHGVAKSATIYSVRVFPCSGTSTLSTILAGVDWVTANHKSPAVANMSLGAAAAPILDTAVERSIRSGVTYVTAGGNNGGDACAMSPGKLPDVINVGAIDETDSRPSWSNYGSCISIFAPGVAVGSADYYSDVALASWNGTSLAAPMVTGAVALYLQEHPTASPATVRSAILSGVDAQHRQEHVRLTESAALHVVHRLSQCAGARSTPACAYTASRPRSRTDSRASRTRWWCRCVVPMRLARVRLRCWLLPANRRRLGIHVVFRRRHLGHRPRGESHLRLELDLFLGPLHCHGHRQAVRRGQAHHARECLGFYVEHGADIRPADHDFACTKVAHAPSRRRGGRRRRGVQVRLARLRL